MTADIVPLRPASLKEKLMRSVEVERVKQTTEAMIAALDLATPRPRERRFNRDNRDFTAGVYRDAEVMAMVEDDKAICRVLYPDHPHKVDAHEALAHAENEIVDLKDRLADVERVRSAALIRIEREKA